jgi:hypothetical protein
LYKKAIIKYLRTKNKGQPNFLYLDYWYVHENINI